MRRDRYLVVTATEGAPPKVIFQFYAQFEASSNSNIIEPHQNSTWVINKRNDFRIRIPLNTDVAKIAIKVSPVTDPNDSRSVAAKPETAAVDKSSTYVEVASQTIPDNYYLLVTFPRIGDTTSPPLDIVQVVKTTQSLEDIIGNPYTLAAALAVPISITWSPGDISNTTARTSSLLRLQLDLWRRIRLGRGGHFYCANIGRHLLESTAYQPLWH